MFYITIIVILMIIVIIICKVHAITHSSLTTNKHYNNNAIMKTKEYD